MTRKSIVVVLGALVLLGGLLWFTRARDTGAPAGASASDMQVVEHAQGQTRVPARPTRVAAFDIAALDTLDALGVPVIGVAGNSFPDYLAGYGQRDYAKLGTLFEPDYEAVNAARPDLIVTGGRSSAKYGELSSLAPTIDMRADDNRYLSTTIANTRMLGGIFGKDAEAQTLAERLNQSVEALKARTGNAGRGLIVLTTGGKMSAYGRGSRFGVIHSDFGVPEAAEGLNTSLHGEAIGAEFIHKTDPDWLFVIDRDAAIGRGNAARALLDNPLVRQTKAWRNKHVVYLDPAVWYLASGGIQATQKMVEEIAAAYAK